MSHFVTLFVTHYSLRRKKYCQGKNDHRSIVIVILKVSYMFPNQNLYIMKTIVKTIEPLLDTLYIPFRRINMFLVYRVLFHKSLCTLSLSLIPYLKIWFKNKSRYQILIKTKFRMHLEHLQNPLLQSPHFRENANAYLKHSRVRTTKFTKHQP